MSPSRFDAIVVGTGQSGPPLAARMAKEGLAVAIVERRRFGGTCVNYGCIPTKSLVASARVVHLARRARDYGVVVDGDIRVDMPAVHARMSAIAAKAEQGVEVWVRGLSRAEVISGHARFLEPHLLEVETSAGALRLSAPRVFLDVGGRAVVPELKGLSEVPHLTNTSLLELSEAPRHLIALGASYLGLEFGQMFRRFGSEVTLLEQAGRILPREDADVSEEVSRLLQAEGIRIRAGVAAESVARRGDGVAVALADGSRVEGSHLLLAVGRRPNTDDLGLDRAGISVDAHGYIQVDDELRTNIDGIWALGDCNGRGAFTHTSYNDYEIVAANLFDHEPRRVSDRIPTYAMFIDPPLGRVGLSEAEVRARGRKALVAKMPVSRIGRARERGETDGFFKAHVDAETKQILGAAFLGIDADEVVQLLLPTMYAKAPYTALTHSVLIHPTVSELVPTLFEDFLQPFA